VVNAPTVDSSEAKPIHHDDGPQDPSDSGDSHDSNSSEKSLNGAELIQEVLKIVKTEERAELMILELMEEYKFSYARLKELLRGRSITLALRAAFG